MTVLAIVAVVGLAFLVYVVGFVRGWEAHSRKVGDKVGKARRSLNKVADELDGREVQSRN